MRIFLDTNVLASSIATRGLCNEVFEAVLRDHVLLTCEPVLVELERVLTSKLHVPGAVAAAFVTLVRDEGTLLHEMQAPSFPIPDADDVPILASAIAGKADVFVTGDKALLDLREIDAVPILSPRELWIRLAGL